METDTWSILSDILFLWQYWIIFQKFLFLAMLLSEGHDTSGNLRLPTADLCVVCFFPPLISWCVAESVMCRELLVTLQVCWHIIRLQSLWMWILKYFSLPQLTSFKRICWKQCCRLKTHFLPLGNHALETVLSSVIEERWMHLHVRMHF